MPENFIPPHAKLLIITRAPWFILRSQYRLGWLRKEEVPNGQDFFLYHANDICQTLLVNHETGHHIARSHPENVLVLRYEDLMDDFDVTMGRLFPFIGEPLLPSLLTRLREIRARNIMPSYGKNFDISPEDAEKHVRQVDSCNRVIALYGY